MKTTKQIQINIPNPCSEDWRKMTKNEKGRHCASCNTTVVDFTKMSDEEIKNYFLDLKGAKTCGHFYAGQLQSDKNRYQSILMELHRKAQQRIKFRPFRYAALFVIGSLLTLTSCMGKPAVDHVEGEVEMTGDTIASVMPVDTIPADTAKTK